MENKDNNLYEIFTRYSYTELMELLQNSKTKEEKDFYAELSNMILQREQMKVIGK
ncbi:hypothetical protein [Clostridium sp.]|uniref:hypothetical protein n=1 Tax=Clostridium sp. TaxID=1506 RepID=UPI003F362543